MVLELLLNGIGDTVIKYNVAYVPKRITSLHKFKMPVVLHGHFPDKEGRLPSQADNCRACTADRLITRSKKGLGSRFCDVCDENTEVLCMDTRATANLQLKETRATANLQLRGT